MESGPVLITGCGRSGTKYTAVAFSALGYPCSHEVVFHPDALADIKRPLDPASALGSSIPEGSSVILLCSDRRNARVVDRRLILPFMEKAGQYWGLPSTDEVSILELERLRALGADFFVVSSDAFWFLRHYGEFTSYLRERYEVLEHSDCYFVCRLAGVDHHPCGGLDIADSFYWPAFFRGEASWVAAPFLPSLPSGSVVLHQVRHPIGVIRSFGRMGFFDQNDGPFRLFAEAYCPTLKHGKVIERLMSYWIDWNLMVEKSLSMPGLTYFRYRIEDMSPVLLKTLCGHAGFDASESAIRATLNALPTNFHTRGSKARDHEINWDTLPNPVLRRRLTDLAERYGYDSD